MQAVTLEVILRAVFEEVFGDLSGAGPEAASGDLQLVGGDRI